MDSLYYQMVQERATEQFPRLVRVVGYDQAVQELGYAMSRELRDHMLFEDETRIIAAVAIESFWRSDPLPIPDNIILGEE